MHQRYVPEPDGNATLEVLTENGSYQIKGLTPERGAPSCAKQHDGRTHQTHCLPATPAATINAKTVAGQREWEEGLENAARRTTLHVFVCTRSEKPTIFSWGYCWGATTTAVFFAIKNREMVKVMGGKGSGRIPRPAAVRLLVISSACLFSMTAESCRSAKPPSCLSSVTGCMPRSRWRKPATGMTPGAGPVGHCRSFDRVSWCAGTFGRQCHGAHRDCACRMLFGGVSGA